MNQCIGDPWKKEAHSNVNTTNPGSSCASLEMRAELSLSSLVNLSQRCGRAHQGSSVMGVPVMLKCFSLHLVTPILATDTQHRWSCRAPEVTGTILSENRPPASLGLTSLN